MFNEMVVSYISSCMWLKDASLVDEFPIERFLILSTSLFHM